MLILSHKPTFVFSNKESRPINREKRSARNRNMQQKKKGSPLALTSGAVLILVSAGDLQFVG
jgi:hypothetical protein